ncbi:MAG: tryptophan--tRNA ligase [Candidatus Pacebacteria bacterium]|jgi:tryptophanyl-tRNA synthetase|nr:tryptophan--tRNA ligase [Candidatus Paceibacterota bacterium]
MTDKKKILLSGVKPTGRPHIGNYFGAMKQFADLQDEYDARVFIADYHAITTVQNAAELSRNTLDVALDYLAIGIDPKKTLLFKQSDLPELCELAWIFNCITTMPYLMRAHAYKDAEAKNKEINVGIFDYPILMTADILIQDADAVPVGQDQKQHVEYARDTAEKFNRIFGETFKLPNSLILDHVKIIPGTDGQKMSKSYGNTIALFAEFEDIKKAVMSIPTNSQGVDESKDPEKDNIFALHKHFADAEEIEEIEKRYTNGGLGYKESKEILISNIEKFIAPLREKRKEFAKDEDAVRKMLKENGEKAREIALSKMKEVKKAVGLY